MADITIPQVLSNINSNPQETPKESFCDENIIPLRKSFSKSNTFDYDINGNLIYNNNDIKNGNINLLGGKDVKKSKTFNENDVIQNVNYNQHLNYGQNYLETVLETLNEMSNSKIDLSGINENKINDDNINEIKNKIENKNNDMEVKENKIRFQESDNNGSSLLVTLSGTNTKKNMLPFK